MALTLIATAVPSSKYTLLSSAVAVSVTAVSWGNVERTARFRQVSVFFLGLKGKCCVNLRRWEQKIDELPLGDGIAEWGWCHDALRLSADWDSPEKIRCPLCVPHLVLVWNVWEILMFCRFLTKKFQPSHLLSFLRYFWSSRSSRTKYLQVPMAFSFSRAHKILSVWRVCKIFKSHEHELQPNNSFYGLLVCLCSSVCVFLWRCMTEQQAVCHSELSTDTQQCLYALALQPVRPVRRQTHTFTDLYDPLSPSRCYIKIPSQRYYTDFRHTCDKLWLGFCFVLFGELWLKCSKTMWHKVKQNCN